MRKHCFSKNTVAEPVLASASLKPNLRVIRCRSFLWPEQGGGGAEPSAGAAVQRATPPTPRSVQVHHPCNGRRLVRPSSRARPQRPQRRQRPPGRGQFESDYMFTLTTITAFISITCAGQSGLPSATVREPGRTGAPRPRPPRLISPVIRHLNFPAFRNGFDAHVEGPGLRGVTSTRRVAAVQSLRMRGLAVGTANTHRCVLE